MRSTFRFRNPGSWGGGTDPTGRSSWAAVPAWEESFPPSQPTPCAAQKAPLMVAGAACALSLEGGERGFPQGRFLH